MAANGKEPTYCMGDDTPHAVLSEKPHLLYDYFKQRFAQVTNPAIDPLRERLVMSLYYKEELNLRETGEVMGVSESRVCQIHSQALIRLKARMAEWNP